MGLENCEIKFDNPSGIFFTGQVVSGKVEFNFSSPKKVRGISISIKGKANVHWTESESYRGTNGKKSTRRVSFNASEEYFAVKYYVLGGLNHDSIELPRGEHIFPYTASLPNFLPSSFEGNYGYIRYTVKATLDRPWKFDQTIIAAFTVISHLDCNSNPHVREPATLTMEKYLYCCCCREGPISGILKLPCTGFVSGQVIPYTFEIDNASTTGILSIKMKIKKKVSYHSQFPRTKTKSHQETIAEFIVGNGIAARDSTTFSDSFILPALPPSNLQYCRIIDLEYEIKVAVSTSGFHADMIGQIPIMLGTIPLSNMMPLPAPTQVPEHTSFASNSESGVRVPLMGWIPGPSGSTAVAAATAPVDPYLLPPPTYEECQFGTKSILDASDSEFTRLNNDKCYAPSYPVYNFNMPLPYPPMPPGTSMVPGASPLEGPSIMPGAPPAGETFMMPVPPPREGPSIMPVPVHIPVHSNSNGAQSAPPPEKM